MEGAGGGSGLSALGSRPVSFADFCPSAFHRAFLRRALPLLVPGLFTLPVVGFPGLEIDTYSLGADLALQALRKGPRNCPSPRLGPSGAAPARSPWAGPGPDCKRSAQARLPSAASLLVKMTATVFILYSFVPLACPPHNFNLFLLFWGIFIGKKSLSVPVGDLLEIALPPISHWLPSEVPEFNRITQSGGQLRCNGHGRCSSSSKSPGDSGRLLAPSYYEKQKPRGTERVLTRGRHSSRVNPAGCRHSSP